MKRKSHELPPPIIRKGKYLFKNNTPGDFILPRPTESNQRIVTKDAEFIGDDYYFSFVPKELLYVKEIESSMPQEKLITEQPPVITKKGMVEFVKDEKEEMQLKETEQEQEVLLLESPLEGIKIYQFQE